MQVGFCPNKHVEDDASFQVRASVEYLNDASMFLDSRGELDVAGKRSKCLGLQHREKGEQ